MRRLSAILLAVFAGGCLCEMSQMVDDARVVARIGVLADPEVGWITETAALETAFAFYRQSKVDAVVIAGAVTKNGYRDQFEVLGKIWSKVFKGTATRLIVEPGEYEVNGFAFAVAPDRPPRRCGRLTFYGGRKLALTDELCFFPRHTPAICAGSMSGIDLPSGFAGTDAAKRAAQARQGLLVSAYSDRAVIRRLDFTQKVPLDRDLAWKVRKENLAYAEDVSDPWEIAADGTAPLPPEVPEFWADTQLKLAIGCIGAETAYTLKWPCVLARFTGARARWYEVEVAFADNPKVPFKRLNVLSDGFCLAEERDMAGAKCVFKASDMPSYSEAHPTVVFSVTPIGCFGKRGKTLSTSPVPLAR